MRLRYTDRVATYRWGCDIQTGLRHTDKVATYRRGCKTQMSLRHTDEVATYTRGCNINTRLRHTDGFATYIQGCDIQTRLWHTDEVAGLPASKPTHLLRFDFFFRITLTRLFAAFFISRLIRALFTIILTLALLFASTFTCCREAPDVILLGSPQPFQPQPVSNQYLNSPYIIHTKINCLVMRIKQIIIWLTDFACCDWSIPGP